jgi:hypothetical protein
MLRPRVLAHLAHSIGKPGLRLPDQLACLDLPLRVAPLSRDSSTVSRHYQRTVSRQYLSRELGTLILIRKASGEYRTFRRNQYVLNGDVCLNYLLAPRTQNIHKVLTAVDEARLWKLVRLIIYDHGVAYDFHEEVRAVTAHGLLQRCAL